MKIDLTGKKFFKLTVLKEADINRDKKKNVIWECECDCPEKTITFATTHDLQSGHKKSCGCLKHQSNAVDLTGMQFGLLTVKKRSGTLEKDRRALWRCKCICGKLVTVRGVDLQSGNTKSCGCLHRNYAKMKKFLNNEYLTRKDLYYDK